MSQGHHVLCKCTGAPIPLQGTQSDPSTLGNVGLDLFDDLIEFLQREGRPGSKLILAGVFARVAISSHNLGLTLQALADICSLGCYTLG